MVPLLMLVAGLAVMLYPAFSNWWNTGHMSTAVQSYDEACDELQQAEREALLDDARRYNEDLYKADCGTDPTSALKERYEALLASDSSGIMAHVKIPAIDVDLPIYHGTSDGVLRAGTGHLDWTSLPVGGASTHCVIAGHTGLPEAELFTKLSSLKEGDTFSLVCLGQTATYEVDKVSTVPPWDTSLLRIERGRDLCTLLTCTPYGQNTDRLLVRGHRVANDEGEQQADSGANNTNPLDELPLVAVLLVVSIAVVVRLALYKSS